MPSLEWCLHCELFRSVAYTEPLRGVAGEKLDKYYLEGNPNYLRQSLDTFTYYLSDRTLLYEVASGTILCEGCPYSHLQRNPRKYSSSK